MSASPTAVNERLARLTEAGTAVWLDQIRRTMVTEGELQRLVDEDSLRGVTSNPSIFEKAILGSSDYDEQIAELARAGRSAEEVFDAIAIRDVQLGCDVLRPVWESLGHRDGFVSLEVGPGLARDGARTLAEVRRLWAAVDRPNLLIKIPGTPEGLDAIEEALAEGININITLLFGVEAYSEVAERYIRAMERRLDAGQSLDVHSVASFFVSRVDTEVDKRLEASGHTELLGIAGLANARAAYRRYLEIFVESDRFARVRAAGGLVQRPLWASTGVKNPAYPDTLYVDGLIAPDTINTMPIATLLAAAERAEVAGPTATIDPGEDLARLAAAGIDMREVTDKLLVDGIALFVEAFDRLIAGVESKREAIVTLRPPSVQAWIPDELEDRIARRVRRADEEGVTRRIWAKDGTLWAPAGTPEVADRLGWLTIAASMREEAPELMAWASGLGHDDVVLLGMGGSSLAPEVLRRAFGCERLHVLDSTDAAAVRAVDARVDPARTIFVVSSKSGGTIETLSHFAHFWERAGHDGSRFVAVTDAGSPLDALAAEHGFLRTFRNAPDIGGRYSALSYFGLVPAALAGIDVRALVEGAGVAEQACDSYESEANAGLWLGCALGELATAGRDKLTFVVDEPIAGFGLWAEQLVAESTGKQGRGVLPVAGEPLGGPADYGEDRVFVHLRNAAEPDEANGEAVAALRDAGQPVLVLDADGPEDLGRIFFVAEFATAVAGWVLEINPFDQPNVQEAKDNTRRVLEDGATVDDGSLAEVLDGAAPPSYVALLGYMAPGDEVDAAVAQLRTAIRARHRTTTTFGYGPRYLHSTGQYHKGGPAEGRFVVLVADGPEDLEVPGRPYTFDALKHAQATGDLQTLRAHGRPACRIVLGEDPARAIRELAERIGS
ncbi:MAG TPA: bifunctional transaldolase/phosoglucose isomerase [Solirubrobacteraceae bacterium]|jgi:transaldolase/glucose-6-phosphate isomerase|nr:bifunctional transaldolase/phosoglucose isomerase [Solirubrobacteraceae bacterium]